MTRARLIENVAFSSEQRLGDGYGGSDIQWVTHHSCRAEFRYQRGKEAAQAGALTGSAVFKVRIRSCAAARSITAAHRMTDQRRSTVYNIREVDAVTDCRWVWLIVETGVAA